MATSATRTETHLAPQLRAVVDKTKREIFLVSLYFVPGKKGVEFLAAAHRRGARVAVITNGLASADGVPVHSKYVALVEAGVELYEISQPLELSSIGEFANRLDPHRRLTCEHVRL